MSRVLQVENLTKVYRSERGHETVAVQDVSFEIDEGKSLGLVGESGSGKSTSARCILQLERPDDGVVEFGGADLCRLRGKQLRLARRGMQAVFQDPLSSLDPRWTVERSVAESLVALGMPAEQRTPAVRAALKRVGLAGKADAEPHQLSGGEAQRVAIARAIVAHPSLLICDEATSALDVSVQAQILNLLRDLRDEFDLTLLFISHDLGVVRFLCDEILVMHNGSIVERGGIHQVLHGPRAGYTKQLIEAARKHW